MRYQVPAAAAFVASYAGTNAVAQMGSNQKRSMAGVNSTPSLPSMPPVAIITPSSYSHTAPHTYLGDTSGPLTTADPGIGTGNLFARAAKGGGGAKATNKPATNKPNTNTRSGGSTSSTIRTSTVRTTGTKTKTRSCGAPGTSTTVVIGSNGLPLTFSTIPASACGNSSTMTLQAAATGRPNNPFAKLMVKPRPAKVGHGHHTRFEWTGRK